MHLGHTKLISCLVLQPSFSIELFVGFQLIYQCWPRAAGNDGY